MSDVNRREFVQTAAGTAAVAATAGSWMLGPHAKAQGANGELRVAVIGFRGRGKHLLRATDAAKNARVVAICDADANVLAKEAEKRPGIFATQDLREILERDDVDAIASATPNHWHGLLTVWACQAGKHVYIEKPISYDIVEGQRIVEAAEKYNVVVQAGYQNRSDAALLPFYEELHAGKYGKVERVHGTCFRPRDTIGKIDTPLTPPSEVDYSLWLGPAEDKPIMRPRLHYDWHWDFNTGNGDVGNQGPHELDLMVWALGDPEQLPKTIVAAGNRFGWNDAADTPNIMSVYFDYDGIPATFEVMDLKTGRGAPYRRGVGVMIYTEQGMFVGGRGGGRWVYKDGKSVNYGKNRTGAQGSDGGQDHMQNFIDAALAGDASQLRAGCVTAVRSAAMAHMANIAYRLGAETTAEGVERAFSGDVIQRDMVARLRESTMMYAVEKTGAMPPESWILGPALTFDTPSMQFTGYKAKEANKLLGRDHSRPEFALPKTV